MNFNFATNIDAQNFAHVDARNIDANNEKREIMRVCRDAKNANVCTHECANECASEKHETSLFRKFMFNSR